MIVVINDTKLHITWHHLKDEKTAPGVTECLVSRIDENNERHLMFTGRSICSALDNYSKNKGRKLSLARAIQNPAFTRPDRKKVWDAYVEMRRGKY